MTSEYIEKVIECECNRIKTTGADGSIADGAMGVALFMIWYGMEYDKDKYIKDGIDIIESRCLHLYSNEPLDFHKGQVGIAMGILWLSSSKIISNQIPVLLRQVDDNIFKNVTSRLINDGAKYIQLKQQIHYEYIKTHYGAKPLLAMFDCWKQDVKKNFNK